MSHSRYLVTWKVDVEDVDRFTVDVTALDRQDGDH